MALTTQRNFKKIKLAWVWNDVLFHCTKTCRGENYNADDDCYFKS